MEEDYNTIMQSPTFGHRGRSYISITVLKKVKIMRISSRTSAEDIAVRADIPDDMWMRATVKKGNLTPDDNARNCYVKRRWVIKTIERLCDEEDASDDNTDEEEDIYDIPSKRFTRERDGKGNRIMKLPPVVELTDSEKMIIDGALSEIDIRGRRHHKKCFFCLNDIGKAYGIKHPRKAISRVTNNMYVYGKDYVKVRVISDNGSSSTLKIYMTFSGMILLLASSESARAADFVTWCCDVLFTALMGSEADRARVGSDVMRISLKCASDLLSRSPNVLEGVYVFAVMEKIGNIAEKLGIQHHVDNGAIESTDLLCKAGKAGKRSSSIKKAGCKYGIPRRLQEHEDTLDEKFHLGKVRTDVVTFGLVGDRDLTGAEKELLKLVRSMARKTVVDGVEKPIKILNHREYFIIPQNKIHELYAGVDKIIQDHEVTKFKTSAELREQKNTIAILEEKLEHAQEKLELNKRIYEAEMKALQSENNELGKKLKRRDKTIARLRAER